MQDQNHFERSFVTYPMDGGSRKRLGEPFHFKKKCRNCTGMWEGDDEFTLFYNVSTDFSWHSGNLGFLYDREVHKHLFQGIAFSFYLVSICGKYREDGEVALRYRKYQFLMTKSQQMKTAPSHWVDSTNSAHSGDGNQSAAHQHGFPHS